MKGFEMIKNKKTVLKGKLGYGTKGIAFTDMGSVRSVEYKSMSNTDFDDLNHLFVNEERHDFVSDIEWDFEEIL